jgi:hypothetical protein
VDMKILQERVTFGECLVPFKSEHVLPSLV